MTTSVVGRLLVVKANLKKNSSYMFKTKLRVLKLVLSITRLPGGVGWVEVSRRDWTYQYLFH